MKIKTKLTLNIIVVLSIVATVVATSIFSMSFINGKLSYLTQRSTPYQMRSLELQREIQGATSALAKANAANTQKELQAFRVEAEKALEDVKNAQSQLESLNSEIKLDVYTELQRVSAELFETTANKLRSHEEAEKSDDILEKRLAEAEVRLKELDGKIRSLQLNRSGVFSTALDNSSRITDRLRIVESSRPLLKDLQMAFVDLQNAQRKPALIVAKGKVNTAANKLTQNEYIKNTKPVLAEVKFF